jgi:hypothetical protein
MAGSTPPGGMLAAVTPNPPPPELCQIVKAKTAKG